MGYGDFKLLAMLGAWLGYAPPPVIIMFSSLVGAGWRRAHSLRPAWA